MNIRRFLANTAISGLRRAFPAHFGLSPKHDHYCDYGWPENLTFGHFYRMYARNGLAAAAVDKTIAKTWETIPALWESENPAESRIEEDIRRHFNRTGILRALMNVDRRSMVGAYAGAIIILRDGKELSEPVERMPAGIEGIASIVPAWEGQLTASEWDNDPLSETYGRPKMFRFVENAVGGNPTKSGAPRDVNIHPDRVLIWSEDGTLNGRSDLEPGYNDLIDAEKIKGAGGEGFWKSARGAPIVEASGNMTPEDLASLMGELNTADAIDSINKQVEDFQSGFDKALILGGLTMKPLTISLPEPEEFWRTAVLSFAASMGIPFKILVGNITGERASTEDAREWALTCMSRRSNLCLPMLYELVARLARWGALPAYDWTWGWADLTEATAAEKIDRASKMAEINAKALPGGDGPYFLPDEVREAAGYAPAEDTEGWAEYLRDREDDGEDVQTERDGRAIRNRYNPDQPRVPAGHPNGGEWTDGDGGAFDSDIAAIRDYTGTGHRKMNDLLRNGKPLDETTAAKVKALDDALAREPFTERATLYRGVNKFTQSRYG